MLTGTQHVLFDTLTRCPHAHPPPPTWLRTIPVHRFLVTVAAARCPSVRLDQLNQQSAVGPMWQDKVALFEVLVRLVLIVRSTQWWDKVIAHQMFKCKINRSIQYIQWVHTLSHKGSPSVLFGMPENTIVSLYISRWMSYANISPIQIMVKGEWLEYMTSNP